MGVLNATPDSFYAGSRGLPNEAADIIDIGGESTRPGAEEISVAVELDRVLPVIDAVHERWPDVPLSIDTQKAEVARQALEHGVSVVNDVSALRFDPAMASVVAEAGCPVVLMHMQGTPRTMQARPRYENVVDEVKRFFEERLDFAARQKISEDRIILDPGIGFGKTLEHNMTILKHLSEFLSLGRPILVGVSRKSFIGRLSAPSPGLRHPLPKGRGPTALVPSTGDGRRSDEGILPPEDRLEGSLAAALWAVQQGAKGLRVHDVGATRKAIRIWEAINDGVIPAQAGIHHDRFPLSRE